MWDSCLLARGHTDGRVGWAVPSPLNSGPLRDSQDLHPGHTDGTCSTSSVQGCWGKAQPYALPFLGHPASHRLHCAPGGVKEPWPLTLSLDWPRSEPANLIPDSHPLAAPGPLDASLLCCPPKPTCPACVQRSSP